VVVVDPENLKKKRKNQTRAERVALRRGQRKVQEEIQQKKNDLARSETGVFEEVTTKNNMLFAQVNFPREAVQDADNLALITEYTQAQADALQSATSWIDEDRFLSLLRRKGMQDPNHPQKFSWAALGGAVGCCYRAVPSVGFMYGPIARPPKEVKARQRREKFVETAEAVVPEQEKEAAQKQTDITAQRHDDLEKRLKKSFFPPGVDPKEASEKLPFLNFICQPKSFTQTVENIFDLSFAVREGNVGLELDEDGLPVITQTKPPEEANHISRKQVIISLSPKDLAEIAEAFEDGSGWAPARRMGKGTLYHDPLNEPDK